LPGTKVNQFNRGLGKSELAQLVQNYNQQYADKITLGGLPAPTLTLPTNYSFNDGFFTQDFRLSRAFHFKSDRLELDTLGEVFNLFNTANLVQYGGNLADTASFGQPGARFTQVFGSGGPRAFQFGVRLSF
jgi:hypothetical protein